MSFATATLTGTYELPNGVPARGTVEIIPNSKVIVDQAGNVTRTGRIKVALDADGHFSQTLIATDDATLEPATGRQYTVVVTLHDSRTAVPKLTGITLATGTTVDVADLISGVEASAVYSSFLTKDQYNALVARVGVLEAAPSAVVSVNSKTGAVVLSASDVGADASGAATAAQSAAIAAASTDATTKANAAQTAAVQRANHTGTQSADTLTDGTTNKAFLATERTKLTGVATGATANSTDAQLRDRSTHTGTQSADTLTDGTTNKAFLATERTKLTGVATGATANSTDAQLRDRTTHTGAQAQSTVTNLVSDLAARQALQQVAATVSADGAAVANKHNPVNATAAARTISLPTGQADGTMIGVEKVDASANTVSIAGNIRGVGSSALPLVWQYEAIMLRADSAGSWWPVAGHKTKTSLDAAYTNVTVAGTHQSTLDIDTTPPGITDITGLTSALAGKETSGAAATAQAFAIQRANHTGTQAESTVTNLVSDLAAKLAAASNLSDLASAATARANLGAAPAQESVNTVATSSTAQTIPDPVTAQSISRITLTANCTLTFPTAGAGKSLTIFLIQDGTGSRTVTWPSTIKWPGGTTPTLTTAANKRDAFTFVCHDGTNWDGFTAGLNFA